MSASNNPGGNENITILTLMGVSGCGKTSVGKMLSARLGWDFIESDDYHSEADIEKMSAGIPLTDDDRWPWLERLHGVIKQKQADGIPLVLACSALKESYRDLLYKGLSRCVYVYLKGDFNLIYTRMRQRAHFMKAHMLQSQFDVLKEPSNAFVVDIKSPVPQIVDIIISAYSLA